MSLARPTTRAEFRAGVQIVLARRRYALPVSTISPELSAELKEVATAMRAEGSLDDDADWQDISASAEARGLNNANFDAYTGPRPVKQAVKREGFQRRVCAKLSDEEWQAVVDEAMQRLKDGEQMKDIRADLIHRHNLAVMEVEERTRLYRIAR